MRLHGRQILAWNSLGCLGRRRSPVREAHMNARFSYHRQWVDRITLLLALLLAVIFALLALAVGPTLTARRTGWSDVVFADGANDGPGAAWASGPRPVYCRVAGSHHRWDCASGRRRQAVSRWPSAYGGDVLYTYDSALRGFAVSMSAESAAAMAQRPGGGVCRAGYDHPDQRQREARPLGGWTASTRRTSAVERHLSIQCRRFRGSRLYYRHRHPGDAYRVYRAHRQRLYGCR